jgi:protein-S-isoprenylcysteine O-methyltransferase Ste14
MILNHIILAMLWIIYCVLHSVLAGEWLKKKLRQRMKSFKWYRLWYTVFAFIFLVMLLYYQVSILTIELFAMNNLIFATGSIVCFLGIVIMAICIRKYFMNLSGLRSLVIENFSNELQITGIHKYIRHPLYLGTFCFIWGLFLLLPYFSLLIANTIITVYTLIGIGLEERKLINEFGESYLKYRSTVPKLIPFLKPKRRV